MKTSLRLTATTTVFLSLASGALLAGTLEPAPALTPVAPPPAFLPSTDWTGGYVGLQLGYADADGDGGLSGDDSTFGLHAGYDWDFGNYVLGAEFDYDNTDIDLNAGAAEIDDVFRLKFRGGYDLGDTLIYATAGAARADTSVGNETGPFVGVGIAYRINDSYTVGAELLEHRFDDVGGTAGADVDVTTFNLRASFRF